MISLTKYPVLLFLVLVNLQQILGKPFFGDRVMCDFLCEDDDGFTTTVNPNDMWDVFCNSCPSGRPRLRTTTPLPLPGNAVPLPPNNLPPNVFPNNFPRGFPNLNGPPPMGFMIYPPSTGMNVTMTPTDGFYTWSFIPWQQTQQTATAASSSSSGSATTAAPTTAGSTTTVASTTAKK